MSRSPASSDQFFTLTDLLRARAEAFGRQRLYTFLKDGESETGKYSYLELDRQARLIAGLLANFGVKTGDRVVLMYPQSLAYVAGFFGCLYAGAVAVTAYPPRNRRHLERIEAIRSDSEAGLALTNQRTADRIAGWFSEQGGVNIPIEATDDLDEALAEEYRPATLRESSLAFLQYTSGSTATPRGVMVTHGNLLTNLEYMQRQCHHDQDSAMVTWLPIFHDLGLIYGILQPLHGAFPCYFMEPSSFVQRPLRWLEAVSRYRGTHNAAPNFAYQLCVDKITPEQRDRLDLSSWRFAMNAAEPVRWSTMKSFAEFFEPAGFRMRTFGPGYGMAEATLTITMTRDDEEPHTHRFRTDMLEQDLLVSGEDAGPEETRDLVGCGRVVPNFEVRIVDPETRREQPPDRVGEIWYNGPNVAMGYHNRPETTEHDFRARLADDPEAGPFLRTGDLGFIREGHLFITGRHKELIIVDGLNYYPQDIELSARRSHPALKPDAGAAFTIDEDKDEKLIVVQELERTRRDEAPDGIFDAIRQAVAEEHDLNVSGIVLIRPGTIPRTSSGKIRRRKARLDYLDGELETVAAYLAKPVMAPETAPVLTGRSADSIQNWLLGEIAGRLKIDPGRVDVRVPIARLGLTSTQTIGLTGDLQNWLGIALAASFFFEHPTIEAVTNFLSGAAATPARVTAAAGPGHDEPIAIVGVGCRLPGGVDGPESYWELLREGREGIVDVPPDRWDAQAYYDEDPTVPGKINTRRGGFVDAPDMFDANFFGITAREAERMDPQQRRLLEVSYEALEDAGLPPGELRGRPVGVFIGIASFDYGARLFTDPDVSDGYSGTGGTLSIAANRLSYYFDFHGPSMAVDTACSSSLVAVDLACRSLREGDAELALAGGVNVILDPALSVNFSMGKFLAPDGRCKAFDAAANGYVRSEGAGVVVLKPLSRALQDGNSIYAVVRGSAVTQDGHSNGLTAPNPAAQMEVLRLACRKAGVSPEEVQYVEAHGTGTSLGDPIEASALGAVYGKQRPPGEVCRIGSVKTNIGHLEAAAGIAGMIKVALSLQRGAIPASLHFHQGNPNIDFEELRLRVQAGPGPEPWPEGPGLAGVSSFGFGGTNAHVLLQRFAPSHADSPGEQAKVRPEGADGKQTPVESHPTERLSEYLLTFSARTPATLQKQAAAYLNYLDRPEADAEFPDICFTAARRRDHLEYRLALAARGPAVAREQIQSALAGGAGAAMSTGPVGERAREKLVFVFPGQGSQWPGMGRELLRNEPVFRAALKECDAAILRQGGWSLLDELTGENPSYHLDRVEITQPALFAMQTALFRLMEHYGIKPDAVMGQSMGEVAAAHAAGVLSLEDAAKIICRRGHLLKRIQGKAGMVLVEVSESEIFSIVNDPASGVTIASHNGPDTFLLVGDPASVQKTHDQLQARDIFAKIINVGHGSHGPQVESLKQEMLREIGDIRPNAGTIPLYSTVTGQRIQGEEMGPAYWYKNLRQTVRVYETAETLLEERFSIFTEISPNPVLLPSFEKILRDRTGHLVATMRKDQPERRAILGALARLFTAGVAPDWSLLFPGESYRAVKLPPYPWERKSYWTEGEATRSDVASSGASLGKPFRIAGPKLDVWKIRREQGEFAAIAGRHGGALFLIEKIQEAMTLVLSGDAYFTLNELDFSLPLPSATGDVTLQIVLADRRVRDEEFHDFRVHLRSEDWPEYREWRSIFNGRIRRRLKQFKQYIRSHETPTPIRERGDMLEDANPEADAVKTNSKIKNIWRGNGEILAELSEPFGELEKLDECLDLLVGAAFPEEQREFLPDRISRVRMQREKRFALWCHAVVRDSEIDDEDGVEGDLRFFDKDERVVLEISGLLLRAKEYLEARAGTEVRGAITAPDPGEIRVALRGQAARILGIPVGNIEMDHPLVAAGLSSMGLFELRNWCRSNYGVTIPLRAFAENMTIRGLVDIIVAGDSASISRTAADDSAFMSDIIRKVTPAREEKPEATAVAPAGPSLTVTPDGAETRPGEWTLQLAGPATNAARRLFCFPGEGLDLENMRGLLTDESSPAGLALFLVSYPGRAERAAEEPFDQLEPVLKELLYAFKRKQLFDRPFSFYGHGMGAIIAYELAYRIQAYLARENGGANGAGGLRHLFFSGIRAPHLSAAHGPVHHLGEIALAERLGRDFAAEGGADLGNLPLLAADLKLRETYVFSWRPPATRPTVLFHPPWFREAGGGDNPGEENGRLREPHFECPLTVFQSGAGEPAGEDERAVEEWRRHSSGPVEVRAADGEQARKTILRQVLGAVDSPPGEES